MWTAKIDIFHKDCVIMPKCIKHKVWSFGYGLGFFRSENNLYFTQMHILAGDEKNKKALIADLKKDKRIKKIEVRGDFMIFLEKEPLSKKFHEMFFNKQIFYIKPDILNPEDGFEHWEVASWDRNQLANFVEGLKKHAVVRLKHIQRSRLKDVFIPRVMPRLTCKQKRALELACQHGYFSVPRRIDLAGLGRLMGISRQAFQEHLRKAESKLMPRLIESGTEKPA